MTLRAHWLEQVTRECQVVLMASLTRGADATHIIETFRARCPPPLTEMEKLLLTGLLNKTYRGSLNALKSGHPGAEGFIDSRRPEGLTTVDEFCVAVSGLVAATSKSGGLRVVERARKWIVDHPSSKITVKRVAAVCGIHPRTLSSLFRTAYDVPIREFIEQTKLTAAVHLLETTDLKLQAVAAELGFGSKTTLYRLVRTRLRSSPLEIRYGKRA